jgi:hypothetical protein
MKKLSEFKDDEAMDALVEILEPAYNLIKDNDFKVAMKGDKEKGILPNRLDAVKVAVTKHRKDVVKMMAVLNETPVEEFHYNLLTLPQMMVEMFNDKELMDFFGYQSETDSKTPSGSAMENIEENQDTSSDM